MGTMAVIVVDDDANLYFCTIDNCVRCAHSLEMGLIGFVSTVNIMSSLHSDSIASVNTSRDSSSHNNNMSRPTNSGRNSNENL